MYSYTLYNMIYTTNTFHVYSWTRLHYENLVASFFKGAGLIFQQGNRKTYHQYDV